MLARRGVLGLAAGAAAMAATAGRAAERLSVVATTGMVADAARAIGGDLVEVRALMGPGVDPHSYRQTRGDILGMSRADLVLWHGLHLEAQLEEFLLKLAARQPVAAVADALPADRLLSHPDHPGRVDPHVWMDPALWSLVAGTIRDALTAAMPAGRETFAANADAWAAQARTLGDWAGATLATVPAEARVLVTAHDAFGYFGRAYGFEVQGIQGISTESEAGLVRIAALVDLLVARRVGAAFVESSVSDRNIRALVEGAAAKGHRVVIGGELFSDAMGAPGTYRGTWPGMIDHNVTTIARALGGQAPEGGRLGLLAAG